MEAEGEWKGRDWEERGEGKLQWGCKVNKHILKGRKTIQMICIALGFRLPTMLCCLID